MLELTVPAGEQYDPVNNLFFYTSEQKLLLEHSLLSLSKWEAKWHKPFLSMSNERSHDEMIDYIRCMTVNKGVDPLTYRNINPSILDEVNRYIDEPMTATTFSKDNSPPSRETVTSEIIYYWMTELNIPFSCEKWHLNRLLTLIKVCSIKKSPGKKMNTHDLMRRNRSLNQSRRKAMHSRG